MRYDVTVPSGLSQVMRIEVESMSEKVRSLGRSIAAGKEEDGRYLFHRTEENMLNLFSFKALNKE